MSNKDEILTISLYNVRRNLLEDACGRAFASASGWESRNQLRKATMKRTIPRTLFTLFSLLIKATRLKECALITIVCLTGCTATVVRWNSVRMREEIMAYYNDEIMDNLIRMKEGLLFLHVDISSVSAQGISQVSGTVGSGDTESFTRTSPSSNMMGALRTITRAATTPFAYSVTPLHNDTLTMTAVPVIGPLPGDGQGITSGPPEVITKLTEVRKPR